MMEYTGKYKTQYSEICGEMVDILEYKSNYKFPWCDCERCGKPIIKKMYVVQSKETGIERFHLGSECIKHFM